MSIGHAGTRTLVGAALAAIGFIYPATIEAAVVYVDAANQSGLEDGTISSPYNTIQEGIDAAGMGDRVQVAAGTYFERIHMKDGVSVTGAGAATTIIDSTGREASTVTFDHVGQSPRFEGFTVRGGVGERAGTIGSEPLTIGGGILILDSSPIISNNVITGNSVTEGYCRGGGIYINSLNQSPQIFNNVISDNTALSSTVPTSGEGGGLYVTSKNSSLLVSDNVFESNVARMGGGIFSQNNGNVTALLQRNVVQFNQAEQGGGIWTLDFNARTDILNNVVIGNGSTAGSIDCDDTSSARYPTHVETCGDGLDNDCNAATPDLFDADADGFRCDQDCDDGAAAVNSGAGENCNDRIDNDCDNLIDGQETDATLLAFGSTMRWTANLTDPGLGITWVAESFNDTSWAQGTYGVGYETESPGAQALLNTLVPVGAYSVYTRARFTITRVSGVTALFLGADWDDGYVAWLNGVEVYRSPQMPAGVPSWDPRPTQHESSNGAVPNYGTAINITTVGLPLLHAGENVLAVGLYNHKPAGSSISPDLVLVPRLSMNFGNNDPDCACADGDGDGYRCDDCNDASAAIHPGAAEICNNGVNDDCSAATADVFDKDGDGFTCVIDCNDNNPAVNPNASEVPCDGLDDDCNPATPELVDADGDLYFCDVDCNDLAMAIHPHAVEFCFDQLDNDCNGAIDDTDLECSCPFPVDVDGDGFRCRDCNDGNPNINPEHPELCDNGIDDDCNPLTADVFDDDGDGSACDVDCNDANPAVHPGVLEKCNDGIDNDCDGNTDGADTGDCGCGDGDGDGYSCTDCNNANTNVNPGHAEVCNNGINDDCNAATADVSDADGDGVTCVSDCDDTNPAIRPSTGEKCNDRIDNDCDNLIDGSEPNSQLVGFGSSMRWLANLADPGLGIGWAAEGFNDSGWFNGIYGVGYETAPPGANNLIATDVTAGTASVYTRARFVIPDKRGVTALFIAADYDDAYVAWLNGVEVYRSPELPPGTPLWNSNAANHESSNGLAPNFGTAINISAAGLPALHNGTNVLAIGVYNNVPAGGGFSSDLVVVPRLSMNFGNSDPDCSCADGDGDGYKCDDCSDSNPAVNPGAIEAGCNGLDDDCNAATPDVIDRDGDGTSCSTDCNDTNPNVHPGNPEIPCDFLDNDCTGLTPDVQDVDGDTYNCLVDCLDNNSAVHPGVNEIGCDDLDNDCDTQTADVIDGDGDGFFCDVDCNDANANVNPDRAEKCNNGIDDDCDGLTDSADTAACSCADTDGDGYRCTDCNNTNANINPGQAEVCNNGLDDDCNAATGDVDDLDGDGYLCTQDCDDTNSFIRPNALEICNNGVNDDCNAATPDVFDGDGDGSLCTVDCIDNNPNVGPTHAEVCNNGVDDDCNATTLDVRDVDGDGSSCVFDCNDGNANVNPGHAEVCNNGVNDDCNAATPDVFDNDADGANCTVDCNDNDAAIRPSAAEKCNDGIDNDCDNLIDAADTAGCNCVDTDGDGYKCQDCNNSNANVYPGHAEVCNNAIDDDCNPATADVGDLDGDGVSCLTDCNDTNPAVRPGLPEICNNGLNDDCNGATPDLFDNDADTYTCNVDCNDSNALINPGRPEIGCNGLNDDCNVATSDVYDADSDGFPCADANSHGGGINAHAELAGFFRIINNTVAGNNLSKGTGAGIWAYDLAATQPSVIANNVVTGNTALVGAGVDHSGFMHQISKNDLFQNAPFDLYNSSGSTATLNGNLFVNPKLQSTAFGNYRLAAGSPAIDAGDGLLAPLNAVDRYPRPFDGDANGSVLPDIGAYEYPSGEVFGLLFTNKTNLTWQVRAGENKFNVYRGSMVQLRTSGLYTQNPAQLEPEQWCGLTAPPHVDSFTPQSTRVVFYLVTLVTGEDEWILGTDGKGKLRPNATPCP